MSEKYESLIDVYDTDADRKAIQKLKELDKKIHEEYENYLVKVNLNPVYFTSEELHLAFGHPSQMEISRSMTESIKPEDVTEYEKVFTTTDEYMAAVERLRKLLPAVATHTRSYDDYVASVSNVEDHWTKKVNSNE